MSLSSLLEKSMPELYVLVTSEAKKLDLHFPALEREMPARYLQVTHELARRFGERLQNEAEPSKEQAALKSLVQLHTTHTELTVDFSEFRQLQSMRNLSSKEMILKYIERLSAVERELKNKIRRYSQHSQNLPKSALEFLQQHPDVIAVLRFFQPADLEKTLLDLQKDIDACRNQLYRRLIEILHAMLDEIKDDDSLEAQQQRRVLAVLDYQHSLDKRNLLHIAAIAGDAPLILDLLTRANEIGLDINALDRRDFCAMQYSLDRKDNIALDVFLNSRCSLALLKAANDNPLLETLPRINSNADIKKVAEHPLAKITFHNYVHQFCSVEKCVEKMNWLNKIETSLKSILPLLDSSDATVREITQTFLDLHNHALPIRTELAKAVGYETTEKQLVKTTLCITSDEYQDLMSDVVAGNLSADDLQYVICLDHLQNQLVNLRSQLQKAQATHGKTNLHLQELAPINALIELDFSCIQAIVIFLLRQKIIDQQYRNIESSPLVNWETKWEKNRAQARQEIKPIILNNAVAAVQNVIRNSLKSIQIKDNLEKVICVYLEPLLYTEDRKKIPEFILKFEKANALLAPQLIKDWHHAKPHIELIINETAASDRKNRFFGPVLASFRIKHLLADIKKTLSPEQLPVMSLFFQALTADSETLASFALEQALNLFDPLDPIRKNWPELTNFILLQVGRIQKYIRKEAFAEFMPQQNIEAPPVATI